MKSTEDLARQVQKCAGYMLPSLVYPAISSTNPAAFVVRHNVGKRGRVTRSMIGRAFTIFLIIALAAYTAEFLGNHFNILYYDAAGVYYLQEHMVRFIETIRGVQANHLLQAVLADLKNPVYISGCRALGLVVTGPLWRQLRESTTSVLKTGSVYRELKRKFDSWSNNACPLLEGIAVSGDTTVLDDVWTSLI